MYRFRQILLMAGDILFFTTGLWFSLNIRYLKIIGLDLFVYHLPLFLVLFFLWAIVNYINGLYNLNFPADRGYTRRFTEAGLMSFILSIGILYILNQKYSMTPKTILLLNVFFGYGLSYLWRIFFNKINGFSKLQTKIIFLGHDKETEEIIKLLKKQPASSYLLSAIIDPNNQLHQADFPNYDIYHSLNALRPAITKHKAHLVVVSPSLQNSEESLREIYQLLFWPVQITDTTILYESLTGRIPPSAFSENWFLENLNKKDQIIYKKINYLINILSIFILGIFFVITFPFIAILIKLTSKGPVLYKQNRIGQYKKVFKIYKFRTMQALTADGGAEPNGAQFAKKDDQRITKIGKTLRKIRLDELPQTINLIKGDLSLIGPRPERPEIVEQLEEKMPYYSLRHIVKPGITGWAAINQHYTDDIETSLQKLQYDLYYIKNRSLLLDLAIILKTINVILRRMGQ